MEHTIFLTDGSEIKVNTSLSIAAMRRLKSMDGIGEGMLNFMTSTSNLNPMELMDKSDMLIQGVYVAYENAKPENPMTFEEFEDRVVFDLINFMLIFVEIIGGPDMGNKYAAEIDKVTKKKRGRR